MRWLVVAALASLSGTALAADDGVIRQPPWRSMPDPTVQRTFLPAKAAAKGVAGHILLRCKGGENGHLEGCVVLSESPPDFGFGDAAIGYAGKFILKSKTTDGRSTAGATIEVPIDFVSLNGGTIKFAKYNPYWDMTPSHEDMAKAWARLPAGTPPGRLIYACDLGKDGHLEKCKLIDSSQPSAPYEQAAEPLLSIFHLTLPPNGMKRDFISIQFPINLRQPDPPPKDPNQVRMVANPSWINGPTAKQMADAFPAAANAEGLKEGQVGLECMVDRAGMMSACDVVGEDPQGKGFGDAAKKVASSMGVHPWTMDGEPVEGAYVDFAVKLTRAAP